MRRGDRLFEIIDIVRRARGPLSAQAIADELEVAKRTVYRDISALMAQGVPLRGEAGVGYVLEPGFHMPPLMLTIDEIEAAVLGAQWVRTRGDDGLARAADSLITKIEAVSPEGARMSFDEPPTSVSPTPMSDPDGGQFGATLRMAIRRRRKVRLVYQDGAGQETTRTIWPIMIGYRDAGGIVAAWCEVRDGFRYFRTDRVRSVATLEEAIPRRIDHLRWEWRAAMDAERQRLSAGGAGKDTL